MLTLVTTASATGVVNIICGHVHASESGYRECHSLEKLAGTILANSGALLIGHAVIGSLN